MKFINHPFRWSIIMVIGIFSFLFMLQSPSSAIDFSAVVKKVAKIPDNIEVKSLNEVAQQAEAAKAGREILQKTGYKADDAIDGSRIVRRAFNETLVDSDPKLLRQFDELDEASQHAALALSQGARNLEEVIPDIAFRSRFLQEGGGETVCALGRYDDLVDDAIRFDIALKAGNIRNSAGARSVTLKDFGRFFYEHGDRAHHFWVSSVRPHWKLWLGGSALTAVLLTPDEYLDAAGNLTKDGLTKIGTFGGDLLGKALSGTIEGIGEGVKQATREASETFYRTFFTSVWGLVSFIVMIPICLLLVPWSRYRLLRRLISLTKPANVKDKQESNSTTEWK